MRPDIGNRLSHGRIVLGTTDEPGWFGIETIWFSLPRYDGPWSVRGARLGGSGEIEVTSEPDTTAQLPATPRRRSRFSSGAIVIPPGPTINTGYGGSGNGYRADPRTTWISAPGCYAWQVDGLGFHELIVFEALAPSRHR